MGFGEMSDLSTFAYLIWMYKACVGMEGDTLTDCIAANGPQRQIELHLLSGKGICDFKTGECPEITTLLEIEKDGKIIVSIPLPPEITKDDINDLACAANSGFCKQKTRPD